MMKGFITIFALLSLLPVSAFAGGAKAKKTLHPKDMFDHEMHTNSLFVPGEIPCETCHINEAYEWKGMNKDGCHQCHGDKSKRLMEGPNKCSMCHENWPVKPKDHLANWERVHRFKAKVDSKTCKNCHNDYFCENCHMVRNFVIERVHKRNYKYFHSIEARANPRKCDSCHQVVFCTSCHTNPRGR